MNVQRSIKKIVTEVEPVREIALRELAGASAHEAGCQAVSNPICG